MQNRPKMLLLMSFIFMGILFSFPLQITLMENYEKKEFWEIFSKISFSNYIVFISLLMNIPLILRASRWLLITLPITSVIIAWNNWLVSSNNNQFYNSTSAWLATLAFLSITHFIFLPSIWKLLRHPEQRRWLQAVRKNISLPLFLEPIRGTHLEMKIFDLSQTGAFVSVEDWKKMEHPLQEGDLVSIKIPIDSLQRMSFSARVIRRTESTGGQYPSGIGLQFTGLSRKISRSLQQLMQKF